MAKAFIIRNKETGVQFVASSGKRVWAATGHAKNAYNQSNSRYRDEEQKMPVTTYERYGRSYEVALPYKEQDVWEVVELVQDNNTFDTAIALLNECLGRVDYAMGVKIKKFLEDFNE